MEEYYLYGGMNTISYFLNSKEQSDSKIHLNSSVSKDIPKSM
jgi:hypothetical protein